MAKKIGAVASLLLVGLLVVATIIMANIKVDNNIDYKNPDEVWVTYNSNTQSQITNQKHVNEIVKLLDKATQDNFLNAMFEGTLKEKAELKHYKNSSGTDVPRNKDFYVIFNYDNQQKVESKGVSYYYTQLVFTVKDTDGEVKTNVYLTEGTMVYARYYELNVDYSEVYNFLTQNGYTN